MGSDPPLPALRRTEFQPRGGGRQPMKLMSIAMKPLCLPPFPLERIEELTELMGERFEENAKDAAGSAHGVLFHQA